MIGEIIPSGSYIFEAVLITFLFSFMWTIKNALFNVPHESYSVILKPQHNVKDTLCKRRAGMKTWLRLHIQFLTLWLTCLV